MAVKPYELTVGQMVVDAINAFLSAAALHLGEATSTGERVAEPRSSEAWLALMGAIALVDELTPQMGETVQSHFRQSLDGLLLKFAERYPDEDVPAPGLFLLKQGQPG